MSDLIPNNNYTSLNNLPFNSDEQEKLLLPSEQDELIIGNDVSLALLDDDVDVEENHDDDNADDRQPDAQDLLSEAIEAIERDDVDVGEEVKPVEMASIEVAEPDAPEPIVITIHDSSDDEKTSDDNEIPQGSSNYESDVSSDSLPLPQIKIKNKTKKGESSCNLGVSKKKNFKKTKTNKVGLAAACEFNSQLEHDFEVSPCFHFNFHSNGCNREPTSIHGNYIKAKLHCCFDCFEIAKAIAFHRRKDEKCPLVNHTV